MRPWPLILRAHGASHLQGEYRAEIGTLAPPFCHRSKPLDSGHLKCAPPSPVSTTQAALVFVFYSSRGEFEKILSEGRLLLPVKNHDKEIHRPLSTQLPPS